LDLAEKVPDTFSSQTLQNIPAGHPRAPMPPASPAQQRAIQAALRGLV
jgi:hypothetical protein